MAHGDDHWHAAHRRVRCLGRRVALVHERARLRRPVRSRCCGRDSLLRADDVDPTASIERVTAAVVEWLAFLGELAAMFDAIDDATAGLPGRPARAAPAGADGNVRHRRRAG
jgi:hypothetical protein